MRLLTLLAGNVLIFNQGLASFITPLTSSFTGIQNGQMAKDARRLSANLAAGNQSSGTENRFERFFINDSFPLRCATDWLYINGYP